MSNQSTRWAEGAGIHETSLHSKLVHGEAGLFACQDIEEGTVVAGFGAVRQLREGEEGTRTRLGYSFVSSWFREL